MSSGDGQIRIRPMVPEDLDEVLVIEEEVYSTPWTRSMFQVEMKGNRFAGLLVAQDGRSGPVIGYICYWILFKELHIMNLTVQGDSRRRGIGRLLARQAVEAAGEKGVRMATLEVRASNQAARRLYNRLGFKVAAVRSGYYRKPREDALIMNRMMNSTA